MVVRQRTREEELSTQPGDFSHAIPAPRLDERPVIYADRVGEWYARQQNADHRKSHGLYLTPVPVADFMAGQIQAEGETLRVLDPAAGTGILACAAVEALVSRPTPPRAIRVSAYEVQLELLRPLGAVLDYLRDWCLLAHGAAVEVEITHTDFILAHAGALRSFGALIAYESPDQEFDAVIANPPYFKVGKDDPRAIAAKSVVHGQPNIYGLFMAVGAALIRKDGDFVFITPRSFASGPYFRQFRETFFEMVRPVQVHVFGSRRDAFSRDEVLQENVVLHAVRDDRWLWRQAESTLTITSSTGVQDSGAAAQRTMPMAHALHRTTRDRILRLPLSPDDEDVLALVDGWPQTLEGLGLDISTGPVVPFRATELIDEAGEVPATHVPLLWMNHVRPMDITWPLDRHKPEYIKTAGAGSLLLPDRNYVLIRRFSAKEEPRRLTAAPYLADRFRVPFVGLENHLNYVHRPGGALSEDEAWGLAALYNSTLLDRYFRCVNGNTQVSATELRAMPLPKRDVILEIGRRTRDLPDSTAGLDDLVAGLIAQHLAGEAVVG